LYGAYIGSNDALFLCSDIMGLSWHQFTECYSFEMLCYNGGGVVGAAKSLAVCQYLFSFTVVFIQ